MKYFLIVTTIACTVFFSACSSVNSDSRTSGSEPGVDESQSLQSQPALSLLPQQPAGSIVKRLDISGRVSAFHRGYWYVIGGVGGTNPATVWNVNEPANPKLAKTIPGIGSNSHNYHKIGDLFQRNFSMPVITKAGLAGKTGYLDFSKLPNLVPYQGPSPAPGLSLTDPLPSLYPYGDQLRTRSKYQQLANITSLQQAIIGNLMILIPTGSNETGVATFDISDPDDIKLLDVLRAPISQYTTTIQIYKNHVILPGHDNKLGGETYRLVGVDFSDPRNLKISYKIKDWPGRYIQFQDDFGYNGKFRRGVKYDFAKDRLEREFILPPGELFTDFYWLPIGSHVFVSGDKNHSYVLSHQDTHDKKPPSVAYHLPKQGERNVAVTSRIGIVIHETLRDETVNDLTVQVAPANGGARIRGLVSITDYDVITFAPLKKLAANTLYRVKLVRNGIKDAAGNGIREYSFTFRTKAGGAPTGPTPLDFRSLSMSPKSPVALGTNVSFSAIVRGSNAIQYRWDFGDGSTRPYSTDSEVSYSYDRPGSYTVVAKAKDASGNEETKTLSIVVNKPAAVSKPDAVYNSSSTIVLDPVGKMIWTVNPDNDSVAVIDAASTQRKAVISVSKNPTSIAVDGNRQVWVTNKDSDSLTIIDADSFQVKRVIRLEHGSAPSQVVFDVDGNRGFVNLSGTGYVREIFSADNSQGKSLFATEQSRSLSISAKYLYVTKFISSANRGEVVRFPLGNFTAKNRETIALQMDRKTRDDSDRARGVPNYLMGIAYHPQTRMIWTAGKKDNVLRGSRRDGQKLTHETTVRSFLGFIRENSGVEGPNLRVDTDDRSLMSAIAFSSNGSHAFAALPLNNEIVVFDAYTRKALFNVATQAVPDGIVMEPSSGRLFVKNFLDRTVSIYNAKPLVAQGRLRLPILKSVRTIGAEKLAADVLAGKQIFYNASDRRMSQDGYLSCASCHLDGGHDGQVWDFTGRGEGFRNTTTLLGQAGDRRGPVHWSGNFDEIQDFEHDIRDNFGGRGFLSTAVFNRGTRNQPLGMRKKGHSKPLDQLAAYVNSLAKVAKSPYRNEDGSMTKDAIAGRRIFRTAGCAQCHSGVALSDSSQGVRHDVGTITAKSGKRLGEDLDGFDTPTLLGLWDTAPYLHDGSAKNLQSIFTGRNSRGLHGRTSNLSRSQINQLADFLLQLESRRDLD